MARETIQALVFEACCWTRKDAAAWAKEHGFSTKKVRKEGEVFVFEQDDEDFYEPRSLKRVSFQGIDGMQVVKGRLL